MQMNALLWVSLFIGIVFWVIPVGLLFFVILFKLGVESWIALRMGYTIGAILSWVWVFLIPWFPGQGVDLAEYTAFWAGGPWIYAAIAGIPGALGIIVVWLVRP